MSTCLCNNNITLIFFLKNINIWLNNSKFVKSIISMFFLEKLLIIDKNVIYHFMYLHIFLKRNDYFYKKIMKVFLSK